MPVHHIVPILNVSNLAASFEWFGKLGWSKGWDWSDPGDEPSFGAVNAGACEIFLCRDGQGGRGGANGVWMSIFVDDVDTVHATCVREQLDVTFGPEDEPWGVREMHVRHPDGHMFRIGSPLAHEHDHDHEHPHPH